MNYDEWFIVEDEFSLDNNCNNETIFSIGNGYLGMRGNFEEGYSGPKETTLDGTYINGFYESEYIKYGEIAYGYAEKSQTMLNVTNSKIIELYIEGERFNLLTGKVKEYKRTLDLKNGVLKRTVLWESPNGKVVNIEIKRIASFNNKHLLAFDYRVTPVNFNGVIEIVSAIDGKVTNITSEKDPRVGAGFSGGVLSIEENSFKGTYGHLIQRTGNTKFSLICAMENCLNTDCQYLVNYETNEHRTGMVFSVQGEKGKTVVLNKYVAYVTSRDYEEEQLEKTAKKMLTAAKKSGFEKIEGEQRSYLDEFWLKSDIKIKGAPSLQQGIRFNMFHLLQSVGRDGKTNIAAKGLTGEGYEGHYFWDTETYILPFFLYSNPEISRKLLEYRYSILDKARERARIMNHSKGALFPWRTIDGEECSAYFPAGTAQYHINADIALAIKRYMEATEDEDFLINYGAEILFETARLWEDFGEYIEGKDNKFCINCVTGPDEYTAIVNNNFYTNLMAKENLQYASDIAQWLKNNKSSVLERISRKINLSWQEVDRWKNAADNMYLPYDSGLKIHPQDDSFLNKAVWDFENTPKDKYPLLMHFHPLVIYRHQVCKQADVVLATFLLSHKFSKEEKKRDYDYYERVTTHDSSLSTCIFSIVASEIGYHEKAYDYFIRTARMDLEDHHGNTKHGIHAANMAGTWMCVVNGFAGMRAAENSLSFSPYVPDGWEEYCFNVTFKGRTINVTVNKKGATYKLLQGSPISIKHGEIETLLQSEAIQEAI